MPQHARRPEWLKIRLESNETLGRVRALVRGLDLNTVCEEARCPNLHECWSAGTATFMILGDVCTRRCGFCSVEKGVPRAVDPQEPRRVAEAVRDLGIRHAVVTSVNRDDLQDGGAKHFDRTISWIRDVNPGVRVEVLVPDFGGDLRALAVVLEAMPDVLNHNVETVPRLYPEIRPQAAYERSLDLLLHAALWRGVGRPLITKSGLMVGLGEEREEVFDVLADLRRSGVDIVTIGQYLCPTKHHVPVRRFVPPGEFEEYAGRAAALGFRHCESGPFVRSSYRAGSVTEGEAS